MLKKFRIFGNTSVTDLGTKLKLQKVHKENIATKYFNSEK